MVQKKVSFCLILFLAMICYSAELETYTMENHCGGEINLITDDKYTGRLQLVSQFTGQTCEVTVESWLTDHLLMFYFENVNIGYNSFCQNDDSFLEVFDQSGSGDGTYVNGMNMNQSLTTSRALPPKWLSSVTGEEKCSFLFKDIPVALLSISGLPQKICGNNKPYGTFTTTGRYLTLKFTKGRNYNFDTFSIVFTAYHTGYCYSYEYECDNGRCIDEEINCNGYNPCGDNSDCQIRLSTIAIVGIATSVACFLVVAIVAVFICCRRRASVVNVYRQFPTAVITPHQQYPPPPPYGVATIQGYSVTAPGPTYQQTPHSYDEQGVGGGKH